MKLYDLVNKLLHSELPTRNSDKLLMWRVWEELRIVQNGVLIKDMFLRESCPTPESITRCRRKIQEKDITKEATASVTSVRRSKTRQKGTHIYREKVVKIGHWVNVDANTVRWVDDE